MLLKKLLLKLNFKDPLNKHFFSLMNFHDFCNIILMLICFVSLTALSMVWLSSTKKSLFLHKKLVEFLWTFIPAFILSFLCFESMSVLYLLEEKLVFFLNSETSFSKVFPMKAMGKQWYWSYEYEFSKEGVSDENVELSYDSYLLSSSALEDGGNRNLETEKPLVMKSNSVYPLNVVSSDTLHSFSVKSLGVKMDAVPGRIKNALLISNFSGMFFGQCSEICGANHSFMPMELEVLSN